MTAGVRLAAVTLAVCFVGALVIWIVLRRRISSEQQERKRRMLINTTGRVGDAMVTDVQGDVLYFSYSLGGVEYMASQDVSALRDLIPADASTLIGPVTLKYSPRNPANSIVICEGWSGLRGRNLPEKRESSAI
jgi:hypothetical protein